MLEVLPKYFNLHVSHSANYTTLAEIQVSVFSFMTYDFVPSLLENVLVSLTYSRTRQRIPWHPALSLYSLMPTFESNKHGVFKTLISMNTYYM